MPRWNASPKTSSTDWGSELFQFHGPSSRFRGLPFQSRSLFGQLAVPKSIQAHVLLPISLTQVKSLIKVPGRNFFNCR